jgi:7-carboxy-7-deazaguanine synthase
MITANENLARLRITEIFYSLQGESTTVGIPTVFIRLTGCPLRCHYCDTPYAFSGGTWMELQEIRERVEVYGTKYITVTGGEPLAQKACLQLLTELCDDGYTVSLETSGALDVANIDLRVIKVMDLKSPGSGEVAKNRYENVRHLSRQDQIKFVICDRGDYEWARSTMNAYHLPERCEVLFAPSYEELEVQQLAEWILEDRLAVRFQIQLHKYLWGDTPGR